MHVQIIKKPLSDGFESFDVLVRTDGKLLRFGCIDYAQAHKLADLLKDLAWIEID